MGVYATQPHIYSALLEFYNQPYWTSNSALSLGEQLYTPKGSQSAGVGHLLVDIANISPDKHNEYFLVLAT